MQSVNIYRDIDLGVRIFMKRYVVQLQNKRYANDVNSGCERKNLK